MKSLSKIVLAAALLTASCTTVTVVDEHLVVEGWIEDGGAPMVFVTSSLVAEPHTWNWDDLSDHILNWATVSIDDGDKTVFLTGTPREDLFPPYVYTTSKIKGEAGKTYKLNVKYGKTEVSAVTTVPAKQELKDISIEEGGDGYVINCTFDAKPGSRYKFFSKRKNKDRMFVTSYLAMANGDTDPGETHMKVNRGYDLMAQERYKMGFDPADTVYVRFCTVDKEGFEFWHQYEELTLFSRNPLVPVTSMVKGNIEGGYGCWIGYGASYYTVEIPEE